MPFRNTLCFVAAAILLGAVLSVQADVPQLINRRGTLKSGGDPADTPDGANATTSITELYTFDGENSGDHLGTVVSGAGDMNNDGHDDLIIAPYNYDGPNGANAGRVYVFSGADGDTLYTFDGEAEDDRFGRSAANAGDVDNDGYPDLIIGASFHDGPAGVNAGKAYVFSGKDGDTLLIFDGEVAGDLFGNVGGAGDVDSNGYDDLIVGASGHDGAAGSLAGRVYVFDGLDGDSITTFNGENSWDRFGGPVSGVGDVDNDGYADLAIGANGYLSGNYIGKVYVYSGRYKNLLWTFEGEHNGASANQVASAGDVNNDGYDDVIVGARSHGGEPPEGNGRAYVFSGPTGNLIWTFDGEASGDRFGLSVSGAGDVDQDGHADLIIGALDHDIPWETGAGRAYVFSGQTGNLLWTFDGEANSDHFAGRVSAAGDVDQDGYADLIISATGHDGPAGDDAGRAYVFSGRGIGCRTLSPYQNEIDVAQDVLISIGFDIEVEALSLFSSIDFRGDKTGDRPGGSSYYYPNYSHYRFDDFMPGEVVTGVMTDACSTTTGFDLEPCVWQFTVEATKGSGAYDPHVQYVAGNGPFRICTADFDNDGDLDLASTDYLSGDVVVFTNNGDGTYPTQATYNAVGQARGICAADFDLDGFIDIAVTNTSNNWAVILENSGGTSFNANQFAMTGTTPWAIVAGDFNADGYPDLATANEGSDDITVVLNDAGDLESPTPADYQLSYEPRSIAAGDLDNDGDLDLVTAELRSGCTNGAVTILKNNGTGGFHTHATYAFDGCPVAVTLADFYGNGNLDLAIARNSMQKLTVMYNDGTANFIGMLHYSVGIWPNELTTGDYNADGNLDLACSNAGSDYISVLLLDGGGDASISSYNSGDAPFGITSGDLNNDGAIDLAVTNYDVDSISVFLNVVPPCDCGVPGDVDGGGGAPNPVDVSYLVNRVYLSQDALHDYVATGCPYENGDVDGSGGAPNPIDVSFLVKKVYQSQDALCPDRCAGCP